MHYLWKPARRYPQDTDVLVATKLLVDHLDASENTFADVKCWDRVLRSPMMQHVRQLTFPLGLHSQLPSMRFNFMPLLTALPRLTTLNLGCRLVRSLEWNAKAQLPPSLTSFSMRGHPQRAQIDHVVVLRLSLIHI